MRRSPQGGTHPILQELGEAMENIGIEWITSGAGRRIEGLDGKDLPNYRYRRL
jgi:hypothetical protein